MAFTPPYDKYVRSVSAFPFYIHYWTDDQIHYYQNCQKTLNYIRLSIDATGSLFCKKIRPVCNEHTEIAAKSQAPIFLYTIMTDITVKSSVPLGQFISESHTIASIFHWLNTWLSDRKPPNEVVTDDSAAMIGAVVKAFCGYSSTKEYLNNCFKLLENKSDKVPVCHVRLDTYHFLKTLYNLTVFKQVKLIVQDIIIVSKYKYRGTKNGQQTRCESSLNKLRNLIAVNKEMGYPEQEKYAKHKNLESNNIFEETELDLDYTLTKFIEEIDVKEDLLITSTDEDVTDVENIFYFPLIKNTLIRVLRKLPLWGNIMCPFFKSDVSNPTSSNVESHFKDIKKLFFNTNFGKLRVDEFIIKQYSLIKGTLRLVFSDLESYRTEKTIIDEHTSINHLEEDTFYDNSIFKDKPKNIEDWRGLVSKKSKKIRSTSVALHVLRNGNITTPVNSNIFTNTCAFDSVIQSYGIAFLDNPRFKKFILEKNNDLTKLIRSMIRSKPKSKQNQSQKNPIKGAVASDSSLIFTADAD
ncbi:hypothetical protein evm_011504 [Chilo suppressalis]|nr:hypothetical protein evm_011504 [Chilo suppressalis]